MLYANKFSIGVSFFMTGLLISAGINLSGCSSIPKNFPPLERARAAYAKAASTEGINIYAPVELYEARQQLEKAERSENLKDMEQASYLAEREAQIAIFTSERKAAENEIAMLEDKREKAILDSRGRKIDIARKRAATAEEKARQLEQELAELQAKRTSRGIVLTVGDVLFAFGKAELMPGAMRSIDKLVAFLRENPERQVAIEGHTDSIGSDEYNYMLSERRAESVRMALVSRGISPDRITSRGLGENYPVASNATDAGRQQNRRVEIIILD
jgi:outer membrane protein OmpA-like peptidoglycan-associated protein